MTAGKNDADLDVVAAGRAIYAEMRGRLETTDYGNFVVIDAGSGDYEVAPNPAAAKTRLLSRRPDARLYETRIGRPKSYKMVSIRQAGGNND